MSLPILRSLLSAALWSLAGGSLAASLTVRVVDQAAATVEDAVVYAVPVAPIASPKPPAPAEIAQVKLAFVSPVTVVQSGGSVTFPNRDTVRHHVYSFSPARIFELRLYSGVPPTPVVFDKAGLVVLGCNIHDRMVGYVMVVDTPWFGKTGGNGLVRIDGLPSGDYKLSVWTPRMMSDGAPKAVRIAGDAMVDVPIALKPAP